MIADWGDFAERAAILEFDCGLSRAEAEAQALREMCDQLPIPAPQGVLGELVEADRWRRALPADAAGLVTSARLPWGFGWVVMEGDQYRPADRDEPATAAFVVPAIADGAMVDLAAQSLALCGIKSRLGAAEVVGAAEVEEARESGEPLYVSASLPQWLRGGCRGCVIVDWRRAAHALDGVRIFLCAEAAAPRLRELTRNFFPAPLVAVPAQKDNRHAA